MPPFLLCALLLNTVYPFLPPSSVKCVQFFNLVLPVCLDSVYMFMCGLA